MSRKLVIVGATSAVLAAVLAWVLSTPSYSRQPLRLQRWGSLPDIGINQDIREFVFPDFIVEEAFVKSRLAARSPNGVPQIRAPTAVTYGVDHVELASLAAAWCDDFRWADSPAIQTLRSLPQFVWRARGIDIHFAHVLSDPQRAEGCPANRSLIRRLPL
jgi:hypothetical protein